MNNLILVVEDDDEREIYGWGRVVEGPFEEDMHRVLSTLPEGTYKLTYLAGPSKLTALGNRLYKGLDYE